MCKLRGASKLKCKMQNFRSQATIIKVPSYEFRVVGSLRSDYIIGELKPHTFPLRYSPLNGEMSALALTEGSVCASKRGTACGG